MDIKCTVEGQKLTIISPRPLPQGSDNFDRFLFTFSEDWDGLMVFAQFRQGDQVSNEYLTDVTVDGHAYQAATVPNWLVPGLATMTLYGTGREDVIGTTNYVVMRVQATGFMGEAVTSDLTETLYQQMVNRFIAYEWRYDIVRDFQGAWEALLASIDSPANTWTELPVTAAAEAPASPADGDYWWDTANSLLKKYVVTEGVGAWETITGRAAEETAPPDVYYYYNTATGKLYRTPITAIPVATTTTVGGVKLDPDNFRIGTVTDDGAGNEGKLYLKTDTALTGEGKPADAAAVGAALAKRLRLVSYTNGTSLNNLPGNSFCYINNLASVPTEDLPSELQDVEVYAWVETLGENEANKRRMQRLFTTRGAVFYVRYWRSQVVSSETIWSWTGWISTPTDSTLSQSGFPADAATVGAELNKRMTIVSFDGGTTLAGQSNNTICRVAHLSDIDADDLPVALRSTSGSGKGIDIAAWLYSSGTINKAQVLMTAARGVYHRFYQSSAWTEWASIPTDNTLSKSGVPADAATVGSELNKRLKGTWMLPVLDSFAFKWTIGKSITNAGNVTNNSHFALSDDIPVEEGQVIINLTPATGYEGNTISTLVALFGQNEFIDRKTLDSGEEMIVPEGCDTIRIVTGYPSTNPNPPTVTRRILDDYFSVRFLPGAMPINLIGDGERPVYVAFGASTTSGAVHHYSGQDITYSANNYPEYAAKALNMKSYNLGVGSTGFMERGDPGSASYGTKRNIMDQIYANDALLQRAGLISIMFGYGNDNYVGSPAAHFPIGSYTDYYPYDEEGYHPSGAEGLNTMLSKGATLMGCLNWCIKWINEHYPYARLVIIFGSPSANSIEKRAVTMTAQTEGPGVSPYVLDIDADVDPYGQYVDHYGQEYGIYLINQEIQKLKKALNIPIINLYYEGNPFSWYSTYAKKPDDQYEYALFSTVGTAEEPAWNSHPNDVGYKMYARYVAGIIAEQFTH